MKTYIKLSNAPQSQLPHEFRDEDVRFSENFAKTFIEQYSTPGNVVFDPFTGFGTTLLVAERLGRIPAGLEFDPRRADYVRLLLRQPEHFFNGDSRRLDDYDLPPFDFSLTSPPYMGKNDTEDPFTSYRLPGSGYRGYLQDLQQIYVQMRRLMKPGARVVIEASNLKGRDGVTALAWDIGNAVAQVLTFEGETILEWDTKYGYGYDHSYALVFSA